MTICMKIVAQGFWIIFIGNWEEKDVCLFSLQCKTLDMTDLGRCCHSNRVITAPSLIQQQYNGIEFAIKLNLLDTFWHLCSFCRY